HWLDLARYADSNGFNIDAPRTIWPYRDWVIDAFNRDLPFDRFTIEQIAGDLLPGATLAQKVATGFQRNTLKNEEGGIDVEQFRIESVVDRVSTTGSVFLGLTVGCAQCHDHKFDPITQRDFYQLFAFYNNADEPTLELPAAGQLEERKRVRDQAARLRARLRGIDLTSPERELAWEKKLSFQELAKLPAAIRAIIAIPVVQRDLKQKETLTAFFKTGDQLRHFVDGVSHPSPLTAAAHVQTLVARRQIEKKI